MDTGAESTVIGLAQAKAYCKFMGVPLKTSYSKSKFRFGGHRQDSLGKISIKVPLGDFAMITEEVDVVKPSVPFLLGLDFMDK